MHALTTAKSLKILKERHVQTYYEGAEVERDIYVLDGDIHPRGHVGTCCPRQGRPRRGCPCRGCPH